ncbi:MAG: MmgE/PrpD family protein [Alphaproteobacteria bacterium]|jgi:2-methylcitrate dehydratase PrpD|nr:MmgE/PrpD family protein [Alphaproteobacteria bacterium]MDP7429790.1 MmgE/PrpD family protein [Alphaproteobacteria bacterium]
MQNAQVLDFLYDTNWSDLPVDIQRLAQTCVFDLLGVAAGSLATAASRMIRDHAVAHFAPGHDAPASRLLFDGRPASPVGAALAGALSIDSLDGHDGYRPAKGHVGVAVLPAILAIADSEKTALDGRSFLNLIVLGYELASRMAVAQHSTTSDYHASGSWNGVACAALAARLLELDQGRAREAMGIAEYHGPRSQMMRCIAHPTMVKDSSGWGAMTGVSAAYLAQAGFSGAPSLIVEAADSQFAWRDLGSRWLIAEQDFKPYPVCRWAHAAIAAVEGLQQRHAIKPETIERIEIFTFHQGCCLNHPRPSTTEQAQYSLPFPVAAMLAKGKVGALEVTSGLDDPDILRLADRVEMIDSAEYNACFPAQRLARATITLSDGARYESDTTPAIGSPETPLSLKANSTTSLIPFWGRIMPMP